MLVNVTQGTLLFALELAEQYSAQGVVSIAVNPGNVHTNLTRYSSGLTATLWVRTTRPRP